MHKHLRIACILLLITMPFLFLGIKKNNILFASLSKGSYFFENTRNSPNITKISLQFPNSSIVTLEKRNDLWHIKEIDDYFASLPKIKSLINILRSTIVYRVDKINNDEQLLKDDNSIKIETYDSNTKLIDSARIAFKNDNNKNHYATLNNDYMQYQVSGDFNFFDNPMEWAHSPIVVINENTIKSIETDNFEVYRNFDGEKFYRSDNTTSSFSISPFISHFKYLTATNIKHSINFDYNNNKKIKYFKISLFNGGIYNIYMYSDGKDFWLNIRPDREELAKKDVVTWLKENSILYDGWFFKIDQQIGLVISNFSI